MNTFDLWSLKKFKKIPMKQLTQPHALIVLVKPEDADTGSRVFSNNLHFCKVVIDTP